MIKYLGSKRVIVPRLVELFEELRSTSGVERVADLFSGTSRVGHALKRTGFAVTSNDHNRYAATLARCYVQADLETHKDRAIDLIQQLNQLAPAPGYFTHTFCEKARFLQPKNGARIDAIRARIAHLKDTGALGDTPNGTLTEELEAILLVSLMEAADRVDSTTGVQMAYLKSWATRSHNDLELRLPDLLPRAKAGPGRALCLDVNEAPEATKANAANAANGTNGANAADAANAANAANGANGANGANEADEPPGAAALIANEVDAVYLDPPYNQHKYLGNYHIWETLVRNDEPEAYGIAMKRTDCRERTSPFNSKPRAAAALHDAINACLSGSRVRHLVLSFSNEGYLTREDLESMLRPHGNIKVLELDHKRYVGAQIGIHNPAGKKVGTPGRLRNTELVFHLHRAP